MNVYLIMSIGGLLGILGHTFFAARKINKRLKLGNIGDVFGELWEHDFLTIIGGFLFFIILLFVASDYIDMKHLDGVDFSQSIPERLLKFKFSNFVKTSSLVAGWFAESIIYGCFGTVEEVLKRKIDNFKKIIGDVANDKNQEL